MNIRHSVTVLCALFTLGLANAQIADPPPVQQKDLTDTIATSESLKTFALVIELAEIKGTLKQKSETDPGFTVFAPTEAAFQKLPKTVLDKLLEDKALLKEVLLYHVLAGKSASTDFQPDKKLKTIQAEEITIRVEDGVTWVNAGKVVAPDIRTTNGLIHQIDTVLIPKSVAEKLGIGI